MNKSVAFAHPSPVLRRDLAVVPVRIGSLRSYTRNARTHSKRQIRQIAASIEEFGFTNPVLIDEANGIVAGHGRVEAARLLGLKAVPCIHLTGLSEAQKRAYVIADNKLGLNAGWDEVLLAEECKGLIDLDPTFDLSLTGFAPTEIDTLLEGIGPEEPGDPRDDRLPGDGGISRPAVSQPGDLWLLGPHSVLCADATDPESFVKLLGEEQAQMVFTDPPYNVPVGGHVSGLGAVKHREFVMASGEMSREEFTAFLARALATSPASRWTVPFISYAWTGVTWVS